MTLRERNDRIAIELTIVTHGVKVALGLDALDGRSQIAQSLLSAEDSSGLTTSSGLGMRDHIEQSVFVVSAGGREKYSATKVIGGSSAPQAIDIVEQLLTEGLRDLLDEDVEVDLTGQDAVEFLIDANHLERGRDRGLRDPAETLTTNRLSAVSSLRNDEQIAVFDRKDIAVAQSDIPEVDQSIEILIALETLDDRPGQDLFDQREQARALTVADVFIIKGGLPAIRGDQSLTQRIQRLAGRILGSAAMISINGHTHDIIHISHRSFLLLSPD